MYVCIVRYIDTYNDVRVVISRSTASNDPVNRIIAPERNDRRNRVNPRGIRRTVVNV